MNWQIPRFDYLAQYQTIRRECLAAIEEVLESGRLILGPRAAELERNSCEFLGAEGDGVAVGNGTDALAVALRALGIGPGDEVLTVSNTAVATVAAIRMVGARPVFCEIDPQTLMMDPADAEKRITSRTRAIVPVHLFGNAADMRAINRVAAERGLFVVEDCAQAMGTLLDGQSVGTWGDIGCFSFYPTKNLGAFGDGGMCFTRNPGLADAMRSLRNYGWDESRCAIREGVNSRLDELQAALLGVKLKYLPLWLGRRRAVGAEYLKHLPSRFVPRATPGVLHSYHLFVVLVDRRQQLIERLKAEGIDSGVHYPVPVHEMPAYHFLGNGRGSLPVTESTAGRVLSLPCYPELPLDAIPRICRIVKNAVRMPGVEGGAA